eukprot:scaffold3737_cov72-Cyclotella_meneghiniana.AAC.2
MGSQRKGTRRLLEIQRFSTLSVVIGRWPEVGGTLNSLTLGPGEELRPPCHGWICVISNF